MDLQKLYFKNEDSEICLPLKKHLEEAEYNEEKVIELHEAIPNSDASYLWCCEYETVFEKGTCGFECKAYKPINGRNGKCEHKGKLFEHGEIESFEFLNNKWTKKIN